LIPFFWRYEIKEKDKILHFSESEMSVTKIIVDSAKRQWTVNIINNGKCDFNATFVQDNNRYKKLNKNG